LGFAIAWGLDSPQGFHAIVNMFLIPLWLLSGALFPASGASGWMRAIMRGNPLTYGVDALRIALFPGHESGALRSLADSIAVMLAFTLIVFLAGLVMITRRTTTPSA